MKAMSVLVAKCIGVLGLASAALVLVHPVNLAGLEYSWKSASLLLALAGKPVSLHMAGVGTLLMYLISLSIHFEKNIVLAISACTLCTGLVGTARLYLQVHGRASVLTGWLIGLVSQLILVRFWF